MGVVRSSLTTLCGLCLLISLSGCTTKEDIENKKLSVIDYNYKNKAIEETYKLSSDSVDFSNVKNLLLSSDFKNSYSMGEQDKLTFESNIDAIKKDIQEVKVLQKALKSEASMYTGDRLDYFTSINSRVLDFDFNAKTYSNYVTTHKFKNITNGELEEMYIINLPLSGYVGTFSVVWLGGDILNVEKYSTSN